MCFFHKRVLSIFSPSMSVYLPIYFYSLSLYSPCCSRNIIVICDMFCKHKFYDVTGWISKFFAAISQMVTDVWMKKFLIYEKIDAIVIGTTKSERLKKFSDWNFSREINLQHFWIKSRLILFGFRKNYCRINRSL